jgi:hypothetical protein
LAVLPAVGVSLDDPAATEGIPYTSIHIRGDLAQDVVGGLGLLLAVFGVYYGFSIGQTKKR